MAKCDLSIELDEPQRVYNGGETITGVIHVRADADVNCKGLEVTSGWKTHGRGNVDTGTETSLTLYEGEWKAGQTESYRFELKVANWPPSYHGHYLNVDHYVDARAKIPWGFDPKAAAPFLMRPSSAGEYEVKESVTKQTGGLVAWVVVSVILLAFFGIGGFVAVATFPCGLILFGLICAIGIGTWFVRVFLPKRLLGEVTYYLDEETLTPGGHVGGQLALQPRRNVNVNGITMKIEAREQVVSGSGSNRTTHKKVFFERIVTLEEATTLQAGAPKEYKLDFTLPDDAPYSLDLDDNDLIWNVELRVDIPRWPDWSKDLTLTVVPSSSPDDASSPEQSPRPVDAAQLGSPAATRSAPASSPPSDSGGELTFAETAAHLWASREDRDQVEMLVEAVTGLTFSIEAIVERRLLYTGAEDPHVYKDGYAVWARYRDPALPLVLYIPHELADEFENIGRDLWTGRGTVVGWDARHERLQVKIGRP